MKKYGVMLVLALMSAFSGFVMAQSVAANNATQVDTDQIAALNGPAINDSTVSSGSVSNATATSAPSNATSGSVSNATATSAPSNASSGSNSNAGISGSGNGTGTAAAALDYHPTTISKVTYENPLSPVNPGHAPTAWMMPNDQICFYNKFCADMRKYERKWTRKQVEGILSHAGEWYEVNKWFTSCGRGFESTRALLDYDLPPTDNIVVELYKPMIYRDVIGQDGKPSGMYQLVQDDTQFKKTEAKYDFLGGIPVKGDKDRIAEQALAWGLKQAMDSGASFATLGWGMNMVYHGSNFSPGASGATATVNNSAALIIGMNSTDGEALAKAVTQLTVYTDKPKPPTTDSTSVSTPATDGKKDGKKPSKVDVQKVNPDMINSSKEEEDDQNIWGVRTSPEIRKRAFGPVSMSIKDIMAAKGGGL